MSLLISLLLVQSAVAAADPNAALIGSWDCAGRFANGKSIASHLSFARDRATGATLVRHDDVAPMAYHAIETWSMSQTGTMRAAVTDQSGMRWFASPGWNDDTLTWSRPDGGVPVEQFAYTLTPTGLHITWSIARNGNALTIGDTLDCRRT